jgi:hypothetical protein
MLMSRHQNMGQNRNITIANTSVENVAMLKYLGTSLTYQNCIHEEITRFHSDSACCHSVQNLLYSCLLTKHLQD